MNKDCIVANYHLGVEKKPSMVRNAERHIAIIMISLTDSNPARLVQAHSSIQNKSLELVIFTCLSRTNSDGEHNQRSDVFTEDLV